MNVQDYYLEPLNDMGDGDDRFAHIYAPQSAVGQARIGVTEQFLEHADTYHARYSNNTYWAMLLEVALARMRFSEAPRCIIDIGSGSGNSVLPLLKQFPHANIIASDISPNLLAILRGYFENDEATQARLGLLCVDASDAKFQTGSADLVVGAAILHHIVAPDKVIAAAFDALKPGGWAVFFEPFRNGSSVVALAYQQVLRQAANESDTADFRAGLSVLRGIVQDFHARGKDLSAEQLMALDDKWMFERRYFEWVRAAQGWAECVIYPLQDGRAVVREQTRSYLRLAADLNDTALPDWAWAIIDEFDSGLTDEVKDSAIREGAVLLRKPAYANTQHASAGAHAVAAQWWWAPSDPGTGLFVQRRGESLQLNWCGYTQSGPGVLFTASLQGPIAEATLWQGTLDGTPFTFSITPTSARAVLADRVWAFVPFLPRGSAYTAMLLEGVWAGPRGLTLLAEVSLSMGYLALATPTGEAYPVVHSGSVWVESHTRVTASLQAHSGGPHPTKPASPHHPAGRARAIQIDIVSHRVLAITLDDETLLFYPQSAP
jgi:SAM-dependent methyltransferase